MKKNERDNQIIEQYKQDEQMMILAYVKWCMSNNLDPFELYQRAYPEQPPNKLLQEMYDQVNEKNTLDDISSDAIVQLLHIFGNIDLAFVVQEEAEKIMIKNHDQNT